MRVYITRGPNSSLSVIELHCINCWFKAFFKSSLTQLVYSSNSETRTEGRREANPRFTVVTIAKSLVVRSGVISSRRESEQYKGWANKITFGKFKIAMIPRES